MGTIYDHFSWCGMALETSTFAAIAAAIAPLLVLLKRIQRKKKAVAFFHPFARDGGGGERVLWCAVQAVQAEHPNARVHLYSGDDASAEELQKRALEVFGVEIQRPVHLVRMKLRFLVQAETYPRLTMIGQAVGSILLGLEAILKLTPAVFIDTSGYAFAYPIAKLAGSKVVAYVHYPTISTDMLARVRQRRNMYNNDEGVSGSAWKSGIKVLYYRCFAALYGLVGRCADVTMVNSTWTRNHIAQLWANNGVHIVYPPCDTCKLNNIDLDRPRELEIISIAQFRPEKDHKLQIESFAHALSKVTKTPDMKHLSNMRLRLVGSCRNAADEARVKDLRLLSKKLGIEHHVHFSVGISYTELVEHLGTAICGIHTMVDEHFGIGVVEYMAAGTIPIAHGSGGPLTDIVVPHNGTRTGFLATTLEEYSTAMLEVISMSVSARRAMGKAARAHASTFSTDRFLASFTAALDPTLSPVLAT
uniref:GDP-Man:Man(3)GlcNAc(2)-PP-Dol alpha-1,2-mannosyltransferase n=1 Tax=Picocystis salinarum TaxID=88271 RepID=A0A7S3U9P3_9CHLO|mmetsp:Transcript_11284/g.69724  ORF Transcript_11284/g.69724 Transcript_11284/m.69724 type:complete len:475 (+) Transcript_11284:408-1832(+)